jgi:hypothetical protein
LMPRSGKNWTKHAGWCLPVINGLMNSINYSYIYHKQ